MHWRRLFRTLGRHQFALLRLHPERSIRVHPLGRWRWWGNVWRQRPHRSKGQQCANAVHLEATTRSPYGYVGGDPLDGSDPSGLITVGGCVSVSVSLLFVHASAQSCIVTDFHSVGTATTTATGSGIGFGAGAGVGPQISTTKDIRDLGGPFSTVGGSAGGDIVPLAGVDYSHGGLCDGSQVGVLDGYVGYGTGWPFEGHSDASNTTVDVWRGPDRSTKCGPQCPQPDFGPVS